MKAQESADKQRLDWLEEEIVDVIYLDDGKIIDVRGNSVREAIDKASLSAKPRATFGATGRLDLLPCPFCGGAPELQDLGDTDSFYVHCKDCEVQQIANYRPHVAARRWNNRKGGA